VTPFTKTQVIDDVTHGQGIDRSYEENIVLFLARCVRSKHTCEMITQAANQATGSRLINDSLHAQHVLQATPQVIRKQIQGALLRH
jgi:hypothetical protein